MSGKRSRYIYAFFLLLSLILSSAIPSQAQVLKVLVTDTFLGTFNGALLGGGTMALANSSNPAPLRYGVGFGTLYGLGLGAVDVSSIKTGKPYRRVSSLNTDGSNAQIILLDTFYGGAAGAVVGFAISLIANKPVARGLQYGSGAGVWAGFGFGVLDAFYFSKPLDNSTESYADPSSGSGLVHLGNRKTSVSLIQPLTIITGKPTPYGIKRTVHAGLQVARLHISF